MITFPSCKKVKTKILTGYYKCSLHPSNQLCLELFVYDENSFATRLNAINASDYEITSCQVTGTPPKSAWMTIRRYLIPVEWQRYMFFNIIIITYNVYCFLLGTNVFWWKFYSKQDFFNSHVRIFMVIFAFFIWMMIITCMLGLLHSYVLFIILLMKYLIFKYLIDLSFCTSFL